MKTVSRLLALLFAAALLLCLAVPASAEGFSFAWDSDDNTPDEGAPHCKSLLLYNLDTDMVVYSMNPDQELPMASMTKIMSYIVAYENIPDIDHAVITVPESVEEELAGTWSSMAEFDPGERYTGNDLLHLMMIPSGNNAALVLAKYVDKINGTGGDISFAGDPTFDPTDYSDRSYFVQLMNEKAQELGCTHTHFTNPHGLHNPGHYSTARDMMRITKYAMGLPDFTEITGTTAWDYSPVGESAIRRTAFTTNLMLTNIMDANSGWVYYYSSATGVKTGSLDESGYCITATATAYGYTYICVAMGSPYVDGDGDRIYLHGEMLDARSLFRWALGDLEKKTIAVQGDTLSDIDLKYAWRKDKLQLAAAQNVAVMLPKSVESSSILIEPQLPEHVEAPVKKGDVIGTADLTYAGEVIGTVELVAAESVSKSEALELWEQGQSVLTAPWFLVILAAILGLIIVYVILIFVYRQKQKKLRRVKKFRDDI